MDAVKVQIPSQKQLLVAGHGHGHLLQMFKGMIASLCLINGQRCLIETFLTCLIFQETTKSFCSHFYNKEILVSKIYERRFQNCHSE